MRSGVSRRNSVTMAAGQDTILRGAAFSAAQTSPMTRAMKKPTTVAWMVTTSPRRRIGRMDMANAQPLDVSHAIPNSMALSPPRAPAADIEFERLHHGRQDKRQAKIHEQRHGV